MTAAESWCNEPLTGYKYYTQNIDIVGQYGRIYARKKFKIMSEHRVQNNELFITIIKTGHFVAKKYTFIFAR